MARWSERSRPRSCRPLGRAWAQPIECLRCGCESWHVEFSPVDDDEPYGLPESFRCPDCGSTDLIPMGPLLEVV